MKSPIIALGALAALGSISYYDTSRATDHKYFLRLQLVLHTGSHGIHATARAFGCSRNTVR
ncbi:MAG: hypothetical protein HY649_01605 [Acidobacteria bacterium]|nr:hypothetical protein [Acidobacteriota bacterium]